MKNAFGLIVFFFLCLYLFARFSSPIPFSMNTIQSDKSDAFTVEGTGKKTGVPDTALVSLGVTKTASTVIDAQNQVNTAAGKIISDIKALGINDKDITTTNYSVTPQYSYNQPVPLSESSMMPIRQSSQITGYTVTENLNIKVKPIDKANKVVDTATGDGANLVGQISFTLNDDLRKNLEKEARKEAVKNAKEKAQSLAGAAGLSLGRIIDIKENNYYPRLYDKSMSAPNLGGSTPPETPTTLMPGENSVEITVSLSYELR